MKKLRNKRSLRSVAEETILLLCTILCLVPIYYFLIGAVKGRRDIVNFPLRISGEMFTMENFLYVWRKMKFPTALFNTAVITAGALVLVILCSSLAGFAIARIPRKSFTLCYSFFMALMVVPFIGCLLALVVLSTKLNLYNSLWGCIFIQAGWNLPFAVFLYTGFMKALPKGLEEAATIDGCSIFRVYWNIFLPLMTPVTATCCIKCGIGIWNDYLVSSALLNSARTPTLMVGIYQFFGEYVSEYGYAFAGVVLSALPIVLAFLFLQKYFIKGLTAGAVKG